jgi:hypothetical protein
MIVRPSLPAILSIGLNSFLELVRSRALLGFFCFWYFRNAWDSTFRRNEPSQ